MGNILMKTVPLFFPTHGALKANMPTERYAVEYNMNHKKRGLALIFNHETFTGTKKIRQGTQIDCTELEKTFKHLQFDVLIYNDCTLKQLRGYIDKAAKQDHTDHDCIAIILLTHGETGGTVYAKDFGYNIDDIFQKFTPEKCPTLAGKPKLFFIQACRGDRSDSGIKLRQHMQTDGEGCYSSMSYRIPLQADYLMVYSTVADYVSYRPIVAGSIFIQSLVKELNKNGKCYDILTLLTFVNQNVAIGYESYMPEEPDYDRKKQMPCFTSMLTRILRFNDKEIQM